MMFEFLQHRDGPIVDGLEPYEVVMGEKQDDYIPLRILPGATKNGQRLSRWTFTAEQREAIASGADIFVELLTFNTPMQPIRIAVSDAPPAEEFREAYNLAYFEANPKVTV